MTFHENQFWSFEKIQEQSIAHKCKFLAKKGFKTFDEDSDKILKQLRGLRNMIAHFKFIICEDGEFRIYNRDITKREIIGILREHGKLLNYSNAVLPEL